MGFEGIFYLDALCKSGVHEFLTLLLFKIAGIFFLMLFFLMLKKSNACFLEAASNDDLMVRIHVNNVIKLEPSYKN